MAKPSDPEGATLTPYEVALGRVIAVAVLLIGVFMIVWALKHTAEHSNPWDLAFAVLGGAMIYLNSRLDGEPNS